MAYIDKAKCIGCGACASICPQGFEIVDGKSQIKDKNAPCLKQAADACPTGAIILEENEEENNKEDWPKKSAQPNQGNDPHNNEANISVSSQPSPGRGLMGRLGRHYGKRGMGRGRRHGFGRRAFH